MSKRHLLFACALAAALLAAGLWWAHGREMRRVRRQFKRLSGWVSKATRERPLSTAYRAQSIGTLFTRPCRLKTHVQTLSGTFTPAEVSRTAAFVRSQFSRLTLRFYDLQITITDKTAAQAVLTARLTGELTNGERVDEAHELRCKLLKVEDAWLFSDCEIVDVLQR